MADSESFGAVHLLTVFAVGEPEGSVLPLASLEYEVSHPWRCHVRTEEAWWPGVMVDVWDCDVWESLNEVGLAWSLGYSGTPVTEPGHYLIQGWNRKYYVWDCAAYEYDCGVGVIAGPFPLSPHYEREVA